MHQVDVMIDNLYQRPVQTFSRVYSRFMEIQNSGAPAYAIGIFQGKTAFNTVNLRKVATQLGAEFIFVIHPRYRNRKPLEENELPGCVPYIEYLDFNDFASKGSYSKLTRSSFAIRRWHNIIIRCCPHYTRF